MIRSRYVDIEYNGSLVQISTKIHSKGDHLVVFLHGFGCAKESFDAAFRFKGLSDLSVCTFDFPGHGKSMRSEISTYSLQYYADITNLLINQIPHKTVSLVCHSMGGAVGLIAIQERSDLRAFISVEGNLVAQDCGIVSRSTADQSLAEFTRIGFKDFLERLRSAGNIDHRAWAKWYAQSDPSALHESASSLVEWSDTGKLLDLFRSLLNQVYIYGENESKDYLLSELVGLDTYAVPRAGHFVMLDNTEGFYSLLTRLLHRPGDAQLRAKQGLPGVPSRTVAR
jgi:pimeloyl-ACP methyl ester carboxylesterase